MKYLLLTTIFLLFGCGGIILPNEEFACRIDGKVFRPSYETNTIFGTKHIAVDYTSNNGFFVILARDYPNFISIYIKLPKSGILEKGTYVFGSGKDDSKATYYNEAEKLNSTIPSNSTNGKIKITNANYKELTGTFEFNSVGQVSGKTYKITKGTIDRKR